MQEFGLAEILSAILKTSYCFSFSFFLGSYYSGESQVKIILFYIHLPFWYFLFYLVFISFTMILWLGFIVSFKSVVKYLSIVLKYIYLSYHVSSDILLPHFFSPLMFSNGSVLHLILPKCLLWLNLLTSLYKELPQFLWEKNYGVSIFLFSTFFTVAVTDYNKISGLKQLHLLSSNSD